MCFSDLSNYEIRLISHISFFLALPTDEAPTAIPGVIHYQGKYMIHCHLREQQYKEIMGVH